MTKQLNFNEFFEEITKLTPIKNQAQLARDLGVGRAAISLAKQKGAVPVKWIIDLCAKYNLNPTYFLSGEGEPYLKIKNEQYKVKIDPLFCSNSEKLRLNILELQGNVFHFSEKNYFYVEVMDNSMSPTFKKGDILFLDKKNIPAIGEIAVFMVTIWDNEEILVRRIGVGEKGLILVADNVTYPHLAYDSKRIEYVGKVIGFFRKL